MVAAATGISTPAWMFANADDHAYALTLLDSASISWLERSLSSVTDDFQRAMLWGALWDEVREATLPPDRYVTLTKEELAAITPRTAREMQIVEFVQLAEVDPICFETSYYVAPDKGGEPGSWSCWWGRSPRSRGP